MTEDDLAGEHARFFRRVARRAGVVAVLSLPVTLVLILGARPLIETLVGWGRFDAEAIDQTVTLLRFLAPAVVFYCLTPVLNSALYAMSRYGLVLYNMLLAAVLNVVLAYALFRSMGLNGVALGATLAAAASVANLAVILVVLSRRHA